MLHLPSTNSQQPRPKGGSRRPLATIHLLRSEKIVWIKPRRCSINLQSATFLQHVKVSIMETNSVKALKNKALPERANRPHHQNPQSQRMAKVNFDAGTGKPQPPEVHRALIKKNQLTGEPYHCPDSFHILILHQKSRDMHPH